jgi:hypothetical protein
VSASWLVKEDSTAKGCLCVEQVWPLFLNYADDRIQVPRLGGKLQIVLQLDWQKGVHSLILQWKFRLRWITVVLHLDPRCDCVDDVILRCLADNKQAVCHMGQGLLAIG